MKKRTLININNGLSENILQNYIAHTIKKDIIRDLKVGIKASFIKKMSGQNGDDFIHDRFSVVIFYDIYKAPRFITKYLLNKIRRGRTDLDTGWMKKNL